MASSHHFTHPRQVLAPLAPPVMLCCSAPPACSSAPLRTSVHYPSISLVNIMYIQTFVTPLPSRWPVLTTLPLLAKFQLVWCRLCEALLSSSLAGQKHPSLLSRLCLKCRRYKGRFALNMKIKPFIFADTVDAVTAMFEV